MCVDGEHRLSMRIALRVLEEEIAPPVIPMDRPSFWRITLSIENKILHLRQGQSKNLVFKLFKFDND